MRAMRGFNGQYDFDPMVGHVGSTAASRALRAPKSKLSRHIALLEYPLGV